MSERENGNDTDSETGSEDGDGTPERRAYGGGEVLISAVIGLAIATLSVWVAAGFAVSSEALFRVAPTIEDRGVGADWLAGNTEPALDFLIALVHAADVLMGVFILVMVFVHWAAFRRLAGQMRQPGEASRGDVAADGGTPTDGDGGPEADSAAQNGGDHE